MSTTRKQLKSNGSNIWPITSASAIHYKYNSSDTNRITEPSDNTDYQLDRFLNGLGDIYLTKDEVTHLATNIDKGPGILYNSGTNTTNVSTPTQGDANYFIKCNYNSAGAFSVSFDAGSYLASTTPYALSGSVGGSALKAIDITDGSKGNILYQNAPNDTAFLTNPVSANYILGWDATNGIPSWVQAENNLTQTLATNASVSLMDGVWEPSSSPILLPSSPGMYALYIQQYDGSDTLLGSYAGVFAINGNLGKLDEIPLHWDTNGTTVTDSSRVYAATQEGRLVLSSTNSSATSYKLTIKCKKLI